MFHGIVQIFPVSQGTGIQGQDVTFDNLKSSGTLALHNKPLLYTVFLCRVKIFVQTIQITHLR